MSTSSPRRGPAPILVPLLVVTLAGAPTSLLAQWPPDSITNLQVLPETLELRALVDVMAGFTRALGVRCSHCHVGEEGQPLSAYDFASDEREAKRKARAMLRMVHAINEEHLAGLPSRSEPPVRVHCVTCHRGVRAPRTLQAELLLAYDDGGLGGLMDRYRELRERYHGRAAYDFADISLADVGSELEARSLADSEAVHALNVEMNPDAWFAQWQHGAVAVYRAFLEEGRQAGVARYRDLRARYHERAFRDSVLAGIAAGLEREGKAEEAAAAWELVLELNPDHEDARARLAALRGG